VSGQYDSIEKSTERPWADPKPFLTCDVCGHGEFSVVTLDARKPTTFLFGLITMDDGKPRRLQACCFRCMAVQELSLPLTQRIRTVRGVIE
jgi:hypothetical protein